MMKGLLQCHQTYFANIGGQVLGGVLHDAPCKEFYLRRLLHCQNAYRIHLHAYRLMENSVLLLFTAQTPRGFSGFTDFLRRSYSDYYRIRFERREETSQNMMLLRRLPSHMLVRIAQKHIERFPFCSKSEKLPGEYPHTSYCANAFSFRPKNLERHRAFHSLLSDGNGALRRYRDFIAAPYCRAEVRLLELHIGCEHQETCVLGRLEKSATLTDIDCSGRTIEKRQVSL